MFYGVQHLERVIIGILNRAGNIAFDLYSPEETITTDDEDGGVVYNSSHLSGR